MNKMIGWYADAAFRGLSRVFLQSNLVSETHQLNSTDDSIFEIRNSMISQIKYFSK